MKVVRSPGVCVRLSLQCPARCAQDETEFSGAFRGELLQVLFRGPFQDLDLQGRYRGGLQALD